MRRWTIFYPSEPEWLTVGMVVLFVLAGIGYLIARLTSKSVEEAEVKFIMHSMGCVGVALGVTVGLGVILAVIYGVVRFIHWAWYQ